MQLPQLSRIVPRVRAAADRYLRTRSPEVQAKVVRFSLRLGPRRGPVTPGAILRFWFGDRPIETAEDFKRRAPLWFGANPKIDEFLRERWGDTIERIARGDFDAWADQPHGRLAMILALDQFPRNAWRGTARAFAYDARACALSDDGIVRGLDVGLPTIQRVFFNMPRGHAEDLRFQSIANSYVDALFGSDPALAPIIMPHARANLATIARFGRFPARNAALGRASTAEELEFLRPKR